MATDVFCTFGRKLSATGEIRSSLTILLSQKGLAVTFHTQALFVLCICIFVDHGRCI